MKTKLIVILYYIFLEVNISKAIFSRNLHSSQVSVNSNIGDVGEPLFLTPYIESGNISEARRLSRVEGLPNAPNITSFSGYLTVNKTHNSNIFFWFFPALNQNASAPVLLWLDGGPGSSSLFSLFVEFGPLVIRKDLKAELNPNTWNQEFSLLFIDNPVGTGFSFTEDEQGYATNQNDVARDLYPALQQFFTVFSDYRQNDFYITGESYAGKYVPAIAYKIHSEGSKANISLKGIAIEGGLCDPITQLAYGQYLYQTGLLDQNQKNYFIGQQIKIAELIGQKEYLKGFDIFNYLLLGHIKGSTYFKNVTGLGSHYNYLVSGDPENWGYYESYLNQDLARKALHVGNHTFNDGSDVVFDHLAGDIMVSVKPWVETLIDNYKVMLYNGQLDIVVPVPLTENFIMNMNWSKSEQYKKSDRIVWKLFGSEREVAGYVRQVDRFYQVVVRNAGHILPYDQPRAALDLITRFVKNQSFEK